MEDDYDEFEKPLNYEESSSHNSTDKSRHNRTIIHIDIDCFYAQVEMLRDPSLRSKPLGIQQKNLMVTCNYVARKAGVKKSCWVAEAKQACPELVLVNGEDLYHYRKMSQQIFQIIRSFQCPVEKLGLDENFVDVSSIIDVNKGCCDVSGHAFENKNEMFCTCGCNERLKHASHLAKDIREKIFTELGITSSAGISYNKMLSKLVGSSHKPNDQTTLFPCDVETFMLSLSSVRKIPNIGSKLTKLLKEHQIEKVTDLQQSSVEVLEKFLDKETAVRILNFSKGIDNSVVKLTEKALSIGLEDRFKMISSITECEEKLKWLLGRLCILIHEDGRLPQTIKVTLRDCLKHKGEKKFCKESRQCKINSSYFTPLKNSSCLDENHQALVMKVLKDLLKKMISSEHVFHLTLLGIAVSDLVQIEKRTSIQSFFIQSPTSLPSPKKLCSIANKQKAVECNKDNHRQSKNKSARNFFASAYKKPKSNDSTFVPPSTNGKMNTLTFSQSTVTSPDIKLKRKLPNGWDENVFAELPSHIQEELIQAHSTATTSNLPLKKKAKHSIKDYLK